MDDNKIVVMINNTFSLITKFSNDIHSITRPNKTMEPVTVWAEGSEELMLVVHVFFLKNQTRKGEPAWGSNILYWPLIKQMHGTFFPRVFIQQAQDLKNN